MAAARMCTHGTSESRVPHGEVHPTWETLLLSRYYVPYIVTNLGDTHAHLKHPPTSRARTPLAHGREGRGWKNKAALLPLRRQGGNLEGLKTGKRQLSRRQRLKYLQALGLAKEGGCNRLLANRTRTQSGAVRFLAKEA